MSAISQPFLPAEQRPAPAYMKFLGHSRVGRAIATMASISFVYFGYNAIGTAGSTFR